MYNELPFVLPFVEHGWGSLWAPDLGAWVIGGKERFLNKPFCNFGDLYCVYVAPT